MPLLTPEVVNFLIEQEQRSARHLAQTLVNEAQEIFDRARVQNLSTYHLASLQTNLADLHRRLTRLEAFREIKSEP